jgi:hypothetical protein
LVTKVSQITEGGVEAQFAVLLSTRSGLNIDVAPGFFVRDSVVTEYAAATTVACTDDDVTYIYIDTNTLAISTAIVLPTEDYVFIAAVTAVSGVITVVVDWRSRSSGVVDTL